MEGGDWDASPASGLSRSLALRSISATSLNRSFLTLTIPIGSKFFLKFNLKPSCCTASSLSWFSLSGPGLEEVHASQVPPANREHCIADPRSTGPPHHPRSKSGCSTSSGEEYCNSPSSRLPPCNSQVFSSERNPLLGQPLNLELAGSQAAFPGKVGPGGLCAFSSLPSYSRPGQRKRKAGSPEPV